MDNLTTLALITAGVAALSLFLSRPARAVDSFFGGRDSHGRAPGLWALALSQVTTWIFARSILNAAILGYFYGIGGALAYAAYYLSFLTGARIIASLRFRHGFNSVQGFLADRFGVAGTASYDVVVALRLLSEVFANLIVIGLIFGETGAGAYVAAILLVAGATLAYSALGGLHAAIRTDVAQMLLFVAALAALLIVAIGAPAGLSLGPILTSTPEVDNPGWVLLAVALLQVWSYPLHDPVMMDRGFIAGRRQTLASFYHAAWISTLAILAFGALGVWAGLNKADGEGFVETFGRLLGDGPTLLFNVALVISCMSTLDSTLSSAAKLTVVDMRLARPTLAAGRIAMTGFMVVGLLLVFFGSKDLFDAVAVSGTASMFLAPVVFFSLWMGRRDVPVWSYLTAFAAAMTAAVLYFLKAGGYETPLAATGLEHKYSHLLVLSAGALVIGCAAFVVGMATSGRRGPAPAAGS